MKRIFMYSGFPMTQIPIIQCPKDNGKLSILMENCRIVNKRVMNGALRCTMCKSEYQITEGILCLFGTGAMDEESTHEQKLRNKYAKGNRIKHTRKSKYDEMDMMEMLPTLAALKLDQNQNILELGCGTGRYTTLLAEKCQTLIAVDFSVESLKILAQKLQPGLPVGLVQADILNLSIAPRFFHRVLSTLVSHLPTREHRLSMHHLASRSLKKNGRFIFSTHYYGIREWYGGVAKSGRYTKGGIYRYYFRKSELKRETQAYFCKFYARPIQITAPFRQRLPVHLIVQFFKKIGLSVVVFSRLAEYIPLINELGLLLLVVVKDPIHPPKIEESSYDYLSRNLIICNIGGSVASL